MFAVSSDGTVEDVSGQFVAASAVADEIVKRLTSNELSREAGDYIRKTAKHGQTWWRTMLFGGYDAIAFEAIANPDGSLRLELQDTSGTHIWHTTLRPAA